MEAKINWLPHLGKWEAAYWLGSYCWIRAVHGALRLLARVHDIVILSPYCRIASYPLQPP